MAKRYMDLVVSVLGLACLWPLLLTLGLLVRMESPGPILFRQKRVGHKGQPFTCYKLRTMAAGPPHAAPQIDDFSTYYFSPPGHRDRRITPIGWALRVTTADEILQLLNVVRGEMSLVGPRPEVPEIVEQYPPFYQRRHEMKPGLTCLAAIRGRSDLTYHQGILYDLEYVSRHSFLRDVAILAQTLLIVLHRRGAR